MHWLSLSSCSTVMLHRCYLAVSKALELLLDARADPNQRDPEYQACSIAIFFDNCTKQLEGVYLFVATVSYRTLSKVRI